MSSDEIVAPREDLASRYAASLERYLAEPDEAALSASYELGRWALEGGYGVTDIVVAHRAAARSDTNGETGPAAARATAFLLECLAPLEMAYLGYREANESLQTLNAQLELRVRERTAQLKAAVGEARSLQLLRLARPSRSATRDPRLLRDAGEVAGGRPAP